MGFSELELWSFFVLHYAKQVFENFNRRSRGGAIFWATDPGSATTPAKGFENQVLGHTSRLYFPCCTLIGIDASFGDLCIIP